MKIAQLSRAAIGVGVLLSFGSPARGETFDLDRIYALAIQRNEQVKIAREEIRFSEEEKKRAFSAVLPRLTLSGTYDRFPEKSVDLGSSSVLLQARESYEMEARLTQPLYSGGKNAAGLQIAEHQIESARKALHLSGEDLLLRTARAYYGALKAQKTLESQRRNVERLKEHRRLSDLRFKVGEVTEAIVLRAEAELAGALAEEVARETEMEVLKRELRILADLPEVFEMEEPALPEIPGREASRLLEIAAERREDLQRSRIHERIGEEEVRFARGSFFPSLSLEGTYYKRGQDPQAAFFIDQSWTAGARLDFPIFEGGLRRAELHQARSRLDQDRLRTADLNKQVELDVTRAFLNFEAVSRELESREDQVRFANKNFEIISRQFTFGLATNIDLLDANQVLVEAERDATRARYDRHLAILEVQRSVGVFLPTILKRTHLNM